jgi:hypothetical protein
VYTCTPVHRRTQPLHQHRHSHLASLHAGRAPAQSSRPRGMMLGMWLVGRGVVGTGWSDQGVASELSPGKGWGVHGDNLLTCTGEVLALMAQFPSAGPEQGQVWGNFLDPVEPARQILITPIRVGWIRITYYDVLQRVRPRIAFGLGRRQNFHGMCMSAPCLPVVTDAWKEWEGHGHVPAETSLRR